MSRSAWVQMVSLLLLLLLLGWTWANMYVTKAKRFAEDGREAASRPHWSPSDTWFWVIGLVMLGMAGISTGLTILRNLLINTHFVGVSAGAMLIDHVIWGLAQACWFGFFAVYCMWGVVRHIQERRSRHGSSGGA